MSINLGLDGLRKAVIRTRLFIDELPEKSRDLGSAMVRQSMALRTAILGTEDSQRQRREARRLSQERARVQATERRQVLTQSLSRVGQRYEAGQAVADKVGAVSSTALGVASFGAKLLRPGYEQATAGNTDSASPGSAPSGGVAALMADNLAGDLGQLNAAIDSISLSVFTQLDGTLRSLTQTATGMLSGVDRWIQDNPVLAGGIIQLVAGGVLLVGALGAIGSVVVPVLSGLNLLMAGAGILSSAFTFAGGTIAAALGAITLPIGLIVAAVAGAALLIYQYWEPISAFFGGVVKSIGEALVPVSELFSPVGQLFDKVASVISWMYDGFWKLMEPVTLTGEALNKVGAAGEFMGKLLVSAFTLPGKMLEKLTSGVVWILEKLGIVDKKSTDAKSSLTDDPPAQRSSVSLGGADYVSPDGPSPVAFGGARYQPVTAGSTNNSQQNTYNSHYEINTHPGMSEAEVLAIMEKNRQQEQFAAGVKQRSSVWG